MFLDEALGYIELIQRRRISDALLNVAIISNPHVKDPKKLVEELQKELRKFDQSAMLETEPERGAFEKLRGIFGQGKKP